MLKPNEPASGMASFRPVALTRTLCKRMERIVARRVEDSIEDKLQPQRARFRPGQSTLDTLKQVTRHVRRRKDGEKTAVKFTDSARPFDSVVRACIVKGVLSFCVAKPQVAWTAGFPKGHAAKVRVNKVLSEKIGLTRGVPQVSALGPVPFIVTVVSLSKRLDCIPVLQDGFFADGRTMVSTSADLSEIQRTIQQGLGCSTRCSSECYVEVSAVETGYKPFGAQATKLLSLKVGKAALKEGARRSCWVSPCNRTRGRPST
ncbi:putative Reverse transcriptase (RNA dependent DNA polymerase) [Trypanosoma vivax]|nr:putative Reverse transcriptase (RNA dependent DNA polymerase) [Trypanosoma vivax]